MATSTINESELVRSLQITSVTDSYSIAASSVNTATNAVGQESGWYPIAIVGFYTGNANISLYKYDPSFSAGEVSIRYIMRNTSTAAKSGTVTFYVLWTR